MGLVQAVRSGDRLALARLLTQVENDTSVGRDALDQLFPFTGRAHLVGVTGSPGTGKSSLVNQLARVFRRGQGDEPPCQVGIVAVDPTSPFSGGALLGDRLRMRDLAGDAGVFIRSMASRGGLGGLARATADVVSVLDAVGFELILIETVGAGQSEVDIARLAHTTVVVEAPGMGDDIQAIKAGILEIADLLVINKADRPGVESTELGLKAMLELGASSRRRRLAGKTARGDEKEAAQVWLPPVLRSIATTGEGVAEIASQIRRHAVYLRQSGEWQRRESERVRNNLELKITQALLARWRLGVSETQIDDLVARLVRRELSPSVAVKALME